jgi:hypothetical protein
MVNYFKLLLIEVIIFSSYIISTVLYNKELNLFLIKDNHAFYEAELNIEIKNINKNIMVIDSLPSDLVDHLKKNKLIEPLEISLNQGQLELFNKKLFTEYKNLDKKVYVK